MLITSDVGKVIEVEAGKTDESTLNGNSRPELQIKYETSHSEHPRESTQKDSKSLEHYLRDVVHP